MDSKLNKINVKRDNINYHKNITVSKSAVLPSPVRINFDKTDEPEHQIMNVKIRANRIESMYIKEYKDEVYKYLFDKNNPLSLLIYDYPEILTAIIATIITGYGPGKSYYDNVKYTSEHPFLEAAIVTILNGAHAGVSTYWLVKHFIEFLRDNYV